MLQLIAALVLLAAWALLTFILPAGLGILHMLLGTGWVLLIRWWALRPAPAPAG